MSTPASTPTPGPTTPGPTTPGPTTPGPTTPRPSSDSPTEVAGLYAAATPRLGSGDGRVSVRDIAAAKTRGQRWAMLTCYDALVAGVLDEAGIPVLLVGDSAANVVYGYETTVPVTVEELLPLAAAVVRGSQHAMVVADLPFGSYQSSPAAALATATRFLKESGAQAVKFEGGGRVVEHAQLLVESGIPVMAHLGLTPQSVHVFGGHRVQGRGGAGEQLLADAKALEAAGAFALVLEAVPAELAERVTASLSIPTIGIGAGAGTDAQVLLWQDMAGLTAAGGPKFVKRYADIRGVLGEAARRFAAEVAGGAYPDDEHSYR